MAENQSVTVHDDDAAGKVERYKEKAGHDSKSRAAKELVEIGFREAEHPTVFRWYERSADLAGFMLIVAILGLVAGWAGVIDVFASLKFAVSSLMIAVFLLSLMLVLRIYYGQTELGPTYTNAKELLKGEE